MQNLFFCAYVRIRKKMSRTEKLIEKLSGILLDEMGKEDYTIAEMSEICGISQRKLCNIIYKEKKGMSIEIFLTICENVEFDYYSLIKYAISKND